MPRRHVLLVTGDEDLLAMLIQKLVRLGLRATPARDARSALTELNNHFADLLILDLDEQDGVVEEICRAMGSEQSPPPVPIIAISDHLTPPLFRCCRDMGARFIPKGWQMWPGIEHLLAELLDIDRPKTRETEP